MNSTFLAIVSAIVALFVSSTSIQAQVVVDTVDLSSVPYSHKAVESARLSWLGGSTFTVSDGEKLVYLAGHPSLSLEIFDRTTSVDLEIGENGQSVDLPAGLSYVVIAWAGTAVEISSHDGVLALPAGKSAIFRELPTGLHLKPSFTEALSNVEIRAVEFFAPIPEPETYGLAFAGALGVFGIVVRHRRRNRQ